MFAFTIIDLLKNAAQVAPHQIAIKDEKDSITYGRLLERTEAFAQQLAAQGVSRGDCVGVCKENSIAAVIALLSVAWCGGVFVVLNVNLKERQIEAIINDCGIKLVLTDHVRKRYLFSGQNASYQLLELDESIAAAPVGQLATHPQVTDRDVACLIYTSGSTGKSKGVIFTHGDVLHNVRIMDRVLRLTPQDNLLCVLPFSADYGLTLLFISLLTVSRITLVSNFLPNDVVNALVSEKITSFHAITDMWPMLYSRSSLFPVKSYPHLRQITIGGGYPPQAIMSRLLEQLHPLVSLYMLYGLTEANWTAVLTPDQLLRKLGSMGTPLPDVEMLLVDGEGRLITGPGEGELVHRGGVVAKGYWGDPDKSAQVFRPIAKIMPTAAVGDEKVVFTGDLVRRDQDGFYTFVARKDDQIKVRGFRISTDDVTDCLYASGLVEAACIFGVPDENTGQRIIACVVLNQAAPQAKEVIVSGLRKQLPVYSLPAELFVLADMPITQSFKQDAKRLQQRYLAGALVDGLSFVEKH